MHSWSRAAASTATAALLLETSSCRSANPEPSDAPVPQGLQLVVRNHNFADMVVWSVGNGAPARIGTVNGNNSGTVARSASMIGASEFRLMATPIGGSGRASSGPLVVMAGGTVVFTIESQLALSHAIIP
jgi:hypothetical protein